MKISDHEFEEQLMQTIDDLLFERRSLKKENDELKMKLDLAIKALEFYADADGGKLARQALKSIGNI